MKKSVWIFLLAVFLPGAVLGWLALRGVEEQQIVFERRTAELYQKETEALAAAVRDTVEAERRSFGDAVHRLLAKNDAHALAADFTYSLADVWPRKAIGFALSEDGNMLSPTTKAAASNPEMRDFMWNNGGWLCSTEKVVVYRVPIDNNRMVASQSKTYGDNRGAQAQAYNYQSRDGARQKEMAQQQGVVAPAPSSQPAPPATPQAAVAPPAAELPQSAAPKLAAEELSKKLSSARAGSVDFSDPSGAVARPEPLAEPSLGRLRTAMSPEEESVSGQAVGRVVERELKQATKEVISKLKPEVLSFGTMQDAEVDTLNRNETRFSEYGFFRDFHPYHYYVDESRADGLNVVPRYRMLTRAPESFSWWAAPVERRVPMIGAGETLNDSRMNWGGLGSPVLAGKQGNSDMFLAMNPSAHRYYEQFYRNASPQIAGVDLQSEAGLSLNLQGSSAMGGSAPATKGLKERPAAPSSAIPPPAPIAMPAPMAAAAPTGPSDPVATPSPEPDGKPAAPASVIAADARRGIVPAAPADTAPMAPAALAPAQPAKPAPAPVTITNAAAADGSQLLDSVAASTPLRREKSPAEMQGATSGGAGGGEGKKNSYLGISGKLEDAAKDGRPVEAEGVALGKVFESKGKDASTELRKNSSSAGAGPTPVAGFKQALPQGGLVMELDKKPGADRGRLATASNTSRSVFNEAQARDGESEYQRFSKPRVEAPKAQIANPAPRNSADSLQPYTGGEQVRLQQQEALLQESVQQQLDLNSSNMQRNVAPQQLLRAPSQAVSSLMPTTAEFQMLTALSYEGMVSRFVQDNLDLIFWMRPPEASDMVFGCLVEAGNLKELWPDVLKQLNSSSNGENPPYVLALLDDKARPVAVYPSNAAPRDWKRPFVASEIGEALPHWEAALYLATPGSIAEGARGVRRTLSFTVAAALALILIGAWLVVADIRRQLALAQQKTDFVSNVSHELKTPLTSIRMFAELMHDRPPPVEKQGQYLRIITVEAERLTRLINNVLDFAKLERKQKRFDKRALDLHDVIGRVWEGNEMHLRDAGFTTRWQFADPPYPVMGDEDALSQVLVNLLSNAEKYSQERKDVELHTWCERGWLNVSVLDRGMGVPEGEERKIFESFYRAHDSLSSGIQGSGLGLTLAQRLAEEHGGKIEFARREGGGSRFTLRIPLIARDCGKDSGVRGKPPTFTSDSEEPPV